MLQRFSLILVFISSLVYGQSYQTVRGTIKESFTERTIEGVVVKLLSENLKYKETVSDADGNFAFADVEIGFYDIEFMMMVRCVHFLLFTFYFLLVYFLLVYTFNA